MKRPFAVSPSSQPPVDASREQPLNKPLNKPVRQKGRVRAQARAEAERETPEAWLEQAEVCREQARDAARLKRFGAARGLFSTALELCRHACAMAESQAEARRAACERLRQLQDEISAYGEWARSMERPLTQPAAPVMAPPPAPDVPSHAIVPVASIPALSDIPLRGARR